MQQEGAVLGGLPAEPTERPTGGNLVEMDMEHAGLCLVCREHRGEVLVPGGPYAVDPHVVVFHVPPQEDGLTYMGHLLVTSSRHVPDFAGLRGEEAAAIGIQIARWSSALKKAGAQRVYTATVGHGVDHLHVHLLPRWPGTPSDVAWHSMDEWPGARRADFEGARVLFESLAPGLPTGT
jgi:histidine triad (HIT) family protein